MSSILSSICFHLCAVVPGIEIAQHGPHGQRLSYRGGEIRVSWSDGYCHIALIDIPNHDQVAQRITTRMINLEILQEDAACGSARDLAFIAGGPEHCDKTGIDTLPFKSVELARRPGLAPQGA